ncbi:alkyl sulfatase [Aspergillus sclerotiicarbonarius CBS 121057]|uniref:Alkyl sulfatase n=1 Tax=Aspergillus sclerotiicarbonarius (strain CBS 121057 / IBT 28362) TaxID=1448318 RepID=A0A319E9F7_ASPSB|nr:alkyl sulfatase [Aspergillus sclerotiicarbonarius CBS 121057]
MASELQPDFENASRGLIGSLQPGVVRAADGRPVYNNDAYHFLHAAECTEGVIIIDPLTSVECAAAALALYRKHRGQRPVTGTTSIPLVAPEGFVEEAMSENIYVGPAMRRRALYMYGAQLPKAPDGQIGCGIGMAVSTGMTSFVPPNTMVTSTGEERTIDGVRIQFQLVPETEAPAEMNFFFPDHRALYIAECATHSLHNIITLRGALVRDAKAWARYLDESLVLFGHASDVLFAGHNWPTWGQKEIEQMISEQRDVYAYLHDQTVRMMNQGLTGIEIAETMTLPPALQTAWHVQGFYGSVSHIVKGIYQRYMGWFDGNPAHLWEYPPVENARRYVACMGGIDQVVGKAERFAQDGDFRFAATLLGHAVSLDPHHEKSRRTLAWVFEKLGFGAENATWRNFYLSAARDLRGEPQNNPMPQSRELNPGQSVEQWLTLLSVRLDGPQAANEAFTLDIDVTDEQRWRLILSNGVLTSRKASDRAAFPGKPGFTMSLAKQRLREILSGQPDLDGVDSEGDAALLHRLLALTA